MRHEHKWTTNIMLNSGVHICGLGGRLFLSVFLSHGLLSVVPLALSASELEKKSSSQSGTSTASMVGRRSLFSSAARLTTVFHGRISKRTRFTLSNRIHGTSMNMDNFHVLNLDWFCSWNSNHSHIHWSSSWFVGVSFSGSYELWVQFGGVVSSDQSGTVSVGGKARISASKRLGHPL